MNQIDRIKIEILAAIGDKVTDAVHTELDVMSSTENLDGRPVLVRFYNMWKSAKGRCFTGNTNKVNSHTAYLLGMTNVAPDDEEFLPVRRCFARKGFPDIDSDFDDEYRDDIYNYIINKYHRENVGNIGTYQSLRLKSYIRKSFKTLDPDNTFSGAMANHDNKSVRNENRERWRKETSDRGDEIAKSLPKQIGANIRSTDEEGNDVVINTVADGARYCEDFRRYIDKYPDLLVHSNDIQGLLSNFSIHAAGVVISNIPLDSIAPLRLSRKKVFDEGGSHYELATQYAYEDLEFMGLIKFDILAISTLSVIRRCIELVKENYGIDIDVENMPLDDKKTFSLYRSGKLNGVFQCENHGMQHTMRELGVDRFEDIIVGVALYRPGPMKSIPQYSARKKGDEPVSYFHDSIKPHVEKYLKPTYGILCYQEQLMQVCNSLAGFSITDGYIMIKAVGKKIPELMAKYENQFVDGCIKNNVPEEVAVQYWKKFITPFADYGFNKSHSTCYAYVSYITAYLKTHYPEEFMVSYMNVMLRSKKSDKYEKIVLFERECGKMNMEVLPRNINTCKWDYEIVTHRDNANGAPKSQIRPSLRCKGLSARAAQEIELRQPYKDLRDFAFNTSPKKVDVKSVECLATAGFFKEKDSKTGRPRKRKIEDVTQEFSELREDRKRASRKGLESDDIFSDKM